MNTLRFLLFSTVCLLSICSSNAQVEPINSPYYSEGPYTVVADSVLNVNSPFLTYRPDNAIDGPYPLFIFHVGANEAGTDYINWHTYDLFLKHLASYGYVVAIMEQIPGPPNGPYFSNTLDYIEDEVAMGTTWMSMYIDTTKVAVGGHSFGGVAASQIISDEPDRVDAIVYFASFPFLVPVIGQDVSQFSGNMLNISGSEDVTSDFGDVLNGYNAYTNTSCKVQFHINGLGHAGFGDYEHPEQTLGSIGRINATATIRHFLVSFMEGTLKNISIANAQFLNPVNFPSTVLEISKDCETLSTDVFSSGNLEAKLSPNPTNSSINLSMALNNVNVDIYTNLGQKVYSKIHNQNVEIDMTDLATGMYIVKLKKENTQRFFKIIKQ